MRHALDASIIKRNWPAHRDESSPNFIAQRPPAMAQWSCPISVFGATNRPQFRRLRWEPSLGGRSLHPRAAARMASCPRPPVPPALV